MPNGVSSVCTGNIKGWRDFQSLSEFPPDGVGAVKEEVSTVGEGQLPGTAKQFSWH